MALRVALVLVCILGVAGCLTSYTPKPGRTMEPIPEFRGDGSVRLRNVQPSTDPIPLRNTFKANRAEWTDVALAIAERELATRGIQRSDTSDRALDFAIVSVKCEGIMTLSTTIEMRVATGAGYSNTYTGVNSSRVSAYLPAQIDGAMTRVVREVLRDPVIVRYLTGK